MIRDKLPLEALSYKWKAKTMMADGKKKVTEGKALIATAKDYLSKAKALIAKEKAIHNQKKPETRKPEIKGSREEVRDELHRLQTVHQILMVSIYLDF